MAAEMRNFNHPEGWRVTAEADHVDGMHVVRFGELRFSGASPEEAQEEMWATILTAKPEPETEGPSYE